jgi:hypothetical protein
MKKILIIINLALSISAFSQSPKGIGIKLVATSGEVYSDDYASGYRFNIKLSR